VEARGEDDRVDRVLFAAATRTPRGVISAIASVTSLTLSRLSAASQLPLSCSMRLPNGG